MQRKMTLLSHVVENDIVEHNEEEDWRSFREAGFLDQTTLREKEKEALLQRIKELERELYQYQYHMGIILIEKEEWDSRVEKLRQEFVETRESQKRMQATHLIVLSQFQNQEESMRKSMSFQKQKIIDLEKALNEAHAENQEMKSILEKKLAEIHALEVEIEEKYMEVRVKMHSLNANIAEASRKSSEIDRRLDDVQVRECKLQKESSFFIVKKKQLEEDIVSQREDFYIWEKKLQERWNKLVEGQIILSERESQANERDMILKKKENELNEAWKILEIANGSFRLQEDIFIRHKALDSKEKKIITKQELLYEKAKKLPSVEEQLNTREKAQSQEPFDDHNRIHEEQRKDLNTEIKKNSTANDIIKDKIDGVASNDIIIENIDNNIFEIEKDHERKMEHFKNKQNKNEMILDVSKQSSSLRVKDLKNKKEEFEKERQILNERTLMIDTTIMPLKLELDRTISQSDDQSHQEKVGENREDKINEFCNENMVDLSNHTILKLGEQQTNFASQFEVGKDNDKLTAASNYIVDICLIHDIFKPGNDVESNQTNKVASSAGIQGTPFVAPDQLVESEGSYKENPQEICQEETHSCANDQVSHNSILKRSFSHVTKTLETDDIEYYETSNSLSDDYEASKGSSEDYEASESSSKDYEASESSSSVRCEEGIENFSSETEVPGLRRYNFRHSTIARAVAVAESLADRSKRKKSDKWYQNENEISNVSADVTNEAQNATPSHEFTPMEIEPLDKMSASRDLSPNNLQVTSSDGVKDVAKHDNKCGDVAGLLKSQEESPST